jgi:hypothetical protein
MLALHPTARRLSVVPLLALALIAAPGAAAVPLMPDGDDPAQVGRSSGAAVPEPADGAASNGLDAGTVAASAVFGAVAFALTALAVGMTLDRRSTGSGGDLAHPPARS